MATKCPKCHSENPDTLKFCGECGTQLPSLKDVPREFTETLKTPIKELTRGSTFAHRYDIIEVLGKGGMGKVYRVFDKKIDEEIALKLIKPEIAADKETIKRFSNELKLAFYAGFRASGEGGNGEWHFSHNGEETDGDSDLAWKFERFMEELKKWRPRQHADGSELGVEV